MSKSRGKKDKKPEHTKATQFNRRKFLIWSGIGVAAFGLEAALEFAHVGPFSLYNEHLLTEEKAESIKEFAEYFTSGTQTPVLEIPQDTASMRYLQSFDGTKEWEKYKAALETISIKLMQDPRRAYRNISLDQWIEERLAAGSEGCFHIYQAGKNDYFMVSAILFRHLHQECLDKIMKNKAEPIDYFYIMSFIKENEALFQPKVAEYLTNILRSIRSSPATLHPLRKEQFMLALQERMRRDCEFLWPVTSFDAGNNKSKKTYSIIGTIHDHNGTGHESMMDILTSKKLPMIVAEYKLPTNEIEMRMLVSGSYTGSVNHQGSQNLPAVLKSNVFNDIYGISIDRSDFRYNRPGVTMDVILSSNVGLHSIVLFEGNNAKEIIPIGGVKTYNLNRKIGYIPTAMLVFDSIGGGKLINFD